MLASLVVLLLTQPVPTAAPAEAVAAQAPAASQSPSSTTAPTNDPAIAWPEEGLTVARPGYGLDVEGISSDGSGGKPAWALSKKTWTELVREDPELASLHRRQHMVAPGIALLASGAAWLAISSALAIDGYYARSAIGSLGQWVMPGTLALTGAIMTTVGLKARRDLNHARRRLYLSPYASRTSGGVTVAARF